MCIYIYIYISKKKYIYTYDIYIYMIYIYICTVYRINQRVFSLVVKRELFCERPTRKLTQQFHGRAQSILSCVHMKTLRVFQIKQILETEKTFGPRMRTLVLLDCVSARLESSLLSSASSSFVFVVVVFVCWRQRRRRQTKTMATKTNDDAV